jgi:hypothetical protein
MQFGLPSHNSPFVSDVQDYSRMLVWSQVAAISSLQSIPGGFTLGFEPLNPDSVGCLDYLFGSSTPE